MLSAYSFAGKPLLSLIDSKPIGVAGCYLVFPLNLDDADWQKFLHATGLNVSIQKESIIPLPSGGVFAEAVLGRSNSAEKLDITRFWNWTDSPIPITAPDISALTAGSRANTAVEGEKPQTFGAPLLNIVNPPAMPDPTAMTAILAAIQNGNMFRDMSGLAGAIGLAQASLASAMQAAQAAAGTAADEAKAAMTQAGKNLETAAKAFEAVYGKSAGGGSGMGGVGGSAASKPPTSISELGSRYNEAVKLDKEAPRSGAGVNGTGKAATGTAPATTTGSAPSNGSASTQSETGTGRRDLVLGTEGASGIWGEFLKMVKGAAPVAGAPPEVRTCCMLAPDSLALGENLTSPANLGLHGTSSELKGQVYCSRAGFVDLGHLRDLCDLTKYVFDQISAASASPAPVRTTHGSAVLLASLPQHEWLNLARAIAYRDSVAYEIYTFDVSSPGGKNSSFSPEDLVSNFLGTVVGARAINATLAGGDFNRTVDTLLADLLADLGALSKADAEAAFALINKRWVDYSNPTSLLSDDYLKRRNMDGIPWQAGYAKDQAVAGWINPAELVPYYPLFRYEFRYDGVSFKDTDFGAKIAAIVTAITAGDPNATSPT